MEEIQIKLADIKEQVGLKIHHPYLLKYIEPSVIDEDKLLLLLSMMKSLELEEEVIDDFSITTTLIQIALDTHEQVKNLGDATEDFFTKKKRELQVLAGDYYSGLYYKILAQSDDITLIRDLASGIKEINEHKIYFYQAEHTDVANFMTSIKKIESALYTKVCEYLNVSVWKELIIHALFVKRLLWEIEVSKRDGMTLFFKSLSKCLPQNGNEQVNNRDKNQREYLYTICNEYMSDSRTKMQQSLEQLPQLNGLLEERLLSFHHDNGKTVVGEG